ncbi:MAG: hypothetical protein U0136_00680 [Bdellovibrionota bacterium]
MAHYRTKLEEDCICGRIGCEALLSTGMRVTRIDGVPVCDYCSARARELSRQLDIGVTTAFRRLPKKLPAHPASERSEVVCSRASCTEVILAGEMRPSIGRYIVCPGCYGSAWHRSKRLKCTLLEAFLGLPPRKQKPKRSVKRVKTRCVRKGCWIVLRKGERRILIAKKWPVCITCHGAICEHARKHNQSIADAFRSVPERRRPPARRRALQCERRGCTTPLGPGNMRRIGKLCFCKSCASQAGKLAKRDAISLSQAGNHLPKKRQLRAERCNRPACTHMVGDGVDRRRIGKQVFCRSCGNTIARLAKRLNISPQAALKRLKPKGSR